MRFRHSALLMLTLAVAACQGEPAPPEETPLTAPSAAMCEKVRAALEEQGRGTGLLFEDSGTAMIEETRWFRMSDPAREAIVQSLAVLAQCGSPQPQREVEVTIRNRVGRIISTRVVGF